MKLNRPWTGALACLFLLLAAGPAFALKTDRQQPLDVDADRSDGTLGDSVATMQGNILIRQGTLLIRADTAATMEAAVDFTIAKAKQVIDEQGTRIFD